MRSLQKALNVDLGFRTDGVATLAVGLRQHGYEDARADVFLEAVLDRARRSAGIEGAAAATRVPVESDATRLYMIPSDALPGTRVRMPLVVVSPGYLDLMRIPLVRGRGIEAGDRAGTTPVAVITEGAAERLWPGSDPIGRQFVAMFGDPITVVGVARDSYFTRLTDQEPQIFLAFTQHRNIAGMDRLRLVATGRDAAAVLGTLRNAVHAVDPRLTTFEEGDVDRQIARILMPQRFGSLLLGVFGLLALLTSCVGIYAVASYDVTRRHRELGIRAALGAQRHELVHAVMLRASIFICGGVVAGVVLAFFAVQGLRGLLFGIESYEATSYLVAVLLLGAAAAVASWLPARRAGRADPLAVIRS